MNFDYEQDQLTFQDTIRHYFTEEYDFEKRRQVRGKSSGTDLEVWGKLAGLGLLAVQAPAWAGGLERSVIDAALIMHEFGRALVVEPFLASGVMAARILDETRTEQNPAELPGLVAGDLFVGLALDEPRSRWAPEKPQTRAENTGGGYRISGAKRMVLGGDAASHFIVSASLDDGLALFMVPADCDGVTVAGYPLLHGGYAADVDFNGIEIPDGGLLAGPADAFLLQRRILDEAALLSGSEAIGCMDRVLELSADYLKQRQQFGQPLANFQVLQQRMADLFVEYEMARSALHGGLAYIDASESTRAKQVSAARIRIDQAGHRIGNQGIHLHGGMGMTLEYPVGHLYRRLVLLAVNYGDSECHFQRFEHLTEESA